MRSVGELEAKTFPKVERGEGMLHFAVLKLSRLAFAGADGAPAVGDDGIPGAGTGPGGDLVESDGGDRVGCGDAERPAEPSRDVLWGLGFSSGIERAGGRGITVGRGCCAGGVSTKRW